MAGTIYDCRGHFVSPRVNLIEFLNSMWKATTKLWIQTFETFKGVNRHDFDLKKHLKDNYASNDNRHSFQVNDLASIASF